MTKNEEKCRIYKLINFIDVYPLLSSEKCPCLPIPAHAIHTLSYACEHLFADKLEDPMAKVRKTSSSTDRFTKKKCTFK